MTRLLLQGFVIRPVAFTVPDDGDVLVPLPLGEEMVPATAVTQFFAAWPSKWAGIRAQVAPPAPVPSPIPAPGQEQAQQEPVRPAPQAASGRLRGVPARVPAPEPPEG